MTSLTDIRAALATSLEAIGDPWSVSSHMLANVPAPCIQVTGPDLVAYDAAGSRGQDVWTILVMAFAGIANDIASQDTLDQLLTSSGPTSVKAAIEADCTLGGIVQDLRVTKMSGYQLLRPELIQAGQPQLYLGCTWDVEVRAEG